jgi:hypothetical protein
MTENGKREGDWDRTEWKGSAPSATKDPKDELTEATTPPEPDSPWVKTEWVGDQGEGAPGPVDPAEMPEGEHTISGDRHAPGVQHWAGGGSKNHEPATGDRDLKRS